jgi:hypothetical protein
VTDGSLVRRWEALSARTQAAIAFPVAFVVMLLLHLGPFNQPTARALGYAVFWGAILTAAIVVASRAERARRLDRERGRPDRGSHRE